MHPAHETLMLSGVVCRDAGSESGDRQAAHRVIKALTTCVPCSDSCAVKTHVGGVGLGEGMLKAMPTCAGQADRALARQLVHRQGVVDRSSITDA